MKIADLLCVVLWNISTLTYQLEYKTASILVSLFFFKSRDKRVPQKESFSCEYAHKCKTLIKLKPEKTLHVIPKKKKEKAWKKKKNIKTHTFIRVRWGEDGAVLPLHLLNLLCQRLDKTPDLLHLARQREAGSTAGLVLSNIDRNGTKDVFITLEAKWRKKKKTHVHNDFFHVYLNSIMIFSSLVIIFWFMG